MSKTKTIIGIMGSGNNDASPELKIDTDNARAFALAVAKRGWVLLTGGRPAGVMHAAHEGADAGGGLIIGILPSSRKKGDACKLVDIPIYTGLGDARNAITGQSPDVVVAFIEDAGPGTISEIALACRGGRPVVLVGNAKRAHALSEAIDSRKKARVKLAADASEAMSRVDKLLSELRD